jgi:hypothetical protein
MSDTIKLTQEELDELRKIQAAYQDKTFAFGQLYIEKLNLSERQKDIQLAEDKIKAGLVDTQKLEQAWTEAITAKYGEGSLSLKDGTFTTTTSTTTNTVAS